MFVAKGKATLKLLLDSQFEITWFTDMKYKHAMYDVTDLVQAFYSKQF